MAVDTKIKKGKKRKRLLDKRGTFIRLVQYAAKYRWMLLLALVLCMISNLLALAGPLLAGKAIAQAEAGPGRVDFSKVFHYAGLMMIFYVISSFLTIAILLCSKMIFSKEVFPEKAKKIPACTFSVQTGIISIIHFITHPSGLPSSVPGSAVSFLIQHFPDDMHPFLPQIQMHCRPTVTRRLRSTEDLWKK